MGTACLALETRGCFDAAKPGLELKQISYVIWRCLKRFPLQPLKNIYHHWSS
jgi:hypothetical protein